MAYLGSWKIDDYLPIPVTTHKFSTGAAFAATSLTYSIYEDATTTGLDEDVDMTPASPFDSVTGFYLARRQLTAAAGFEKGKNYTVLIKATVDSVAAIAAHTFQIEAEVDSNVVSGTVGTVTNLTNLPTMPADWVTASGLKADAVTEIQNGLALEATLTAIKGAGWTDETLVSIIDYLTNAGVLVDAQASGMALESTLAAMKGVGWTNQTLVKIVTDIAAISAGSGATAQEVWEYATRVLTAGTNIDLSALATAANLATLDGKADAILEDTGTTLDTLVKDIPTNAELATALGTADDAVLAALATTDGKVDSILEDTGTTIPATLATIAGYTDGIAGDVWSSPIRTLTVPAVAAAATEDGTTLTLYKDADINIEFTGLTIPTGAKKVVFTIKDNLDDADTASALQATYQLTAVPAETHTLNYINSAVPPVLTTPVTFTVDTDSVEFDMTAAAAYYLPRYERGYLHWDLKLITDTTVQILQQGLVQILGTSTRAVA